MRPATTSDYPSFAALFPELTSDVPVPGEAKWTSEMVERALVAEESGAVVGYVVAHVLLRAGHVGQLVVAPTARGRGVGRALMDAAASRFRSAGLLRWGLNVRVDNASARHLYTTVGMSAGYASALVRFDRWVDVEVAANVEATPLSPDEDRAAESATGVEPGRLLDARSRPSRVVRVLRRGGAFVGAAVFDPELGLAQPFRVAEPALAGTLLAAFRPHARLTWLDVKVDADPDLVEALCAAGAVVRVNTVHYEGGI